MTIHSTRAKLAHALRIDKAIRFVWEASPALGGGSLFLIFFQGMLPALSLYLIRLIIDAVSAAAPFDQVAWLIGCVGAVAVFGVVLGSVSDYIRKVQALTVADHMFSLIHGKTQELDLGFFESPAHADTLHRAIRESPYRPTSIVNGLERVGRSLTSLIGIFWILAGFSGWLIAAMAAAAIPGILLRLKHSGEMYAWRQKRTTEERKSYYYDWMLTGKTTPRRSGSSISPIISWRVSIPSDLFCEWRRSP